MHNKPSPITFKGSTLKAILIHLQTLCPETLTEAAQALFGENDFFEGDAAVLNLTQIRADPESPPPDWQGIRALFARHGLHVVGICGAEESLTASARKAGLAVFPNTSGGNARHGTTTPSPAQGELSQQTQEVAESAEITKAAESVEPAPMPRRTLLIDRPLRSGQRVHAHDSDLVITAIVNPGAEVIADGNIHIYAPLRGRALAGASGDIQARVFATCFEAELIAIAGSYLTFANGVPPELNKHPVQARLENADGKPQLIRLKLD
jgi:septum site-determining protein MinC